MKHEAICAIKGTAKLSEQAATAVQELSPDIESQLNVFEEMLKSSDELNGLAKDMNESLMKYKL